MGKVGGTVEETNVASLWSAVIASIVGKVCLDLHAWVSVVAESVRVSCLERVGMVGGYWRNSILSVILSF